MAVTVPLSIAVTRPAEVIVAFPVPLTIDHVTDLFVAFDGNASADSCSDPPSAVIIEAPPDPVTTRLVSVTI